MRDELGRFTSNTAEDRERYDANMEIAKNMLSEKSDATKALEDSTEANLMLAQQFEELRLATEEEREVLAEHARTMKELFGKKAVQSPDFSLDYEDDAFVYSESKPRTAQESGAQAEYREYDEKSLLLLEAIRDNTAQLAGVRGERSSMKLPKGRKDVSSKSPVASVSSLLMRYAEGIIGAGIAGWMRVWKVIEPDMKALGKWIADTGKKIYDSVVSVYDGLLDATEWIADALPRAWDTVKEGIGYIADGFRWAGDKVRDGAMFIYNSIKDAWDSVKAWFGFGPTEGTYTSSFDYALEGEKLGELGPAQRKTKAEIDAGFDPWHPKAQTKYTPSGDELPTAGITSAGFKEMQREWKQDRPQRDKRQRVEAHEQKTQQGLMLESAAGLKDSVTATKDLTKGILSFKEWFEKRFDSPPVVSGDAGIGLHTIPSISPDSDLRGLHY